MHCQVTNFDPFEIFKPVDIFYKVDSRFNNTITLERLQNAKSITSLFPDSSIPDDLEYYNVELSILHQDGNITVKGENDKLNANQLKLIQTIECSNDILLSAKFGKKGAGCRGANDRAMAYYMTVIPEQEATYLDGNESLIRYLKEQTKQATSIITEEKLRPGKVHFTVDKFGAVVNVKLDASSGYMTIDDLLVKTISEISSEWTPAKNANGEAIDQDLVFFFGAEGC